MGASAAGVGMGMSRGIGLWGVVFLVGVSACGGKSSGGASLDSDGGSDSGQDSGGGGGGGGGGADTVVPTGASALLPWLSSGAYLDWPSEAAIHASTGPHFGEVRTFLSPALAESLAAGAGQHPVDSAAVKELYGSGGGTEILGYSVMVRTNTAADGGGWYWLEQYAGTTYADGEGDALCTGCHSAGVDFVLTPWPQ